MLAVGITQRTPDAGFAAASPVENAGSVQPAQAGPSSGLSAKASFLPIDLRERKTWEKHRRERKAKAHAKEMYE